MLVKVFESVFFLGLLHFWIKHRLSYWKRSGVCSVKGKYLVGNMKKFWNCHIAHLMAESYRKLKHKDVIGGFYYFLRPILLVFDPTLIGRVLAKDSAHFTDPHHNPQADPHLLPAAVENPYQCTDKITPTFTTDKLKSMFNTVLQVGTNYEHHVKHLNATGKPIDVTDLCSQFTIDVAARCGFGVECNSFKEPNNKFREMGRKVASQSVGKRIKLFLLDSFPWASQALRVSVVDSKINKFFERLIEDRMAVGDTKQKCDMISSLMELNRGGDDGSVNSRVVGKLTVEEMRALTMSFFTGGYGYEATAATMSWCIYEVAKSGGGVQDKLIEEVNRVLKSHQGRVSYEAVAEMTFLEQVVLETLRMHPTVPTINRQTSTDYHVPDSTHILTHGNRVVIPVYAIHHDADYYPQPEEFNPERFTDAEIEKRPPYTFLPFGSDDDDMGPRACIGMRLAMLQIKLALVLVLRRYRFTVNGRTKKVVKINPKSPLIVPKSKIWVDLSEHE